MNRSFLKQSMIVIIQLAFSVSAWAQSMSPVGKWKTIDDETKQPKSIVEITEANGKLSGKIIQLFRKPEEDQNPRCDKCLGDKKDKPILQLEIIEGLTQDGDTWSGGTILDPKNGKTYKCKIKVVDGRKKMEVRGFIGFSLLGRTQVWERN